MKLFFTKFHGLNKRCCNILLLIFCLLSSVAFAGGSANVANEPNVPPKTITGIINDQNGIPLPGVSIKVKDKSIGAVTDVNGKFTINVPEGSSVLVVSFIGFTTQEISIESRSSINVNLSESASKLDEVVIVGYGSQSREKLTTSISKLDTKVLENIPYTNLGSALQGNIAGLQVQSTSGQPGAAPRIVLRGGTSINNPNGAAPLYIIDGVIKGSGLNDINADDVESMQVLKDAASTAIYGARGSNGVIIVTTKSGKAGKTNVSYSYDISAANALRLQDYANARDYIYYGRLSVAAAAVKTPTFISRLTQANGLGTGNDLTKATGFTTQYLTPANQYKLNEGWESMQDPIDPTKTIIFQETNYQDLIYQTGISHNHNLNLSGGTEKATFNAGLGYLSGEGTAIETFYKRLSLNLNGSLKIKDNLNVNGRLLYTNRTNKTVANFANTFFRSASLPGTAKYQFEDGTIAPGQNSSIGNPDYFFRGPYAPKGDAGVEGVTMSLGSKWDIVKGLSFEPIVSLFRGSSDVYSFQPAALLNGGSTLITTRNASSGYSKTTQYQADAVLTYIRTVANKHNLEAKAGFSHYSRNNLSQSANGQGAVTDLIPTLNASALPTNVSGSISDLVIQGAFSRINYDYDGKYLLSLNARYDGASNLGATQKFGFFPGISVGWNVNKEEFWGKLLPENLIDLKLRASYGVNGNISGLGDFQSQGSYSVSGLYAGQGAIQASVIPNENLRWEESKTLDFGADIGLFDRRVSLIFDYYNRLTENLLTTVSLPASTGYTSVLTNLGSLQNKGYEIELGADLLPAKSAVKWNVSFNAGHTSRKIKKLPDNGIENNRVGGFYVYDRSRGDYAWLGGTQEGGRLGDIYAYRQLGVYATDADAAKGPLDLIVNTSNKTKYGGDAYFEDLDGNNIIDDRDRVYVGNPYPTWTGGFNNYISYKNLGLAIRTDFTTGNTIYNYPAVFGNGQLQGDALPFQSYIDKMWKMPGDITNTPRYVWQDQTQNFLRGNSTDYQKGDFLAIREVTLSYTLPSSLIRRAKLNNVRLNLTGNNLHYFTAHTGLVPEDGGMDNGHYPIPRTFIFGANVTF
ncbi:MAG: TonB-dependent receptor [Phormidesmis sp. FL-bin-119]|nr:TonB-dependent receptor [Pedobacter sp.]